MYQLCISLFFLFLCFIWLFFFRCFAATTALLKICAETQLKCRWNENNGRARAHTSTRTHQNQTSSSIRERFVQKQTLLSIGTSTMAIGMHVKTHVMCLNATTHKYFVELMSEIMVTEPIGHFWKGHLNAVSGWTSNCIQPIPFDTQPRYIHVI